MEPALQIVIELLILLVLVFIALELWLLRADLNRASSQRQSSDEPAQASPTVNVNVGIPMASASRRSQATRVAPAKAIVPEPELVAEPAAEAVAPPTPPKAVHQITGASAAQQSRAGSGLGIIKCPACQSENSSFRPNASIVEAGYDQSHHHFGARFRKMGRADN